MRKLTSLLFLLACAVAANAQPRQSPAGAGDFVARMMEFDANQDGKLTKSEVTDERLARLFDRADTNHDGILTKAELTAFYSAEAGAFSGGPGQGGFGGGPGRGGPPNGMHPGQILSQGARQMLELTTAQQTALAALQSEVDAKLGSLLTSEQKARLKEMAQRGPGGGGPPRRPPQL